MAFLVLYLVAISTATWGVLASVWITPPYAGSAVCSLTLVIAYAFAASRPRITVKVGADCSLRRCFRQLVCRMLWQAS